MAMGGVLVGGGPFPKWSGDFSEERLVGYVKG
jgi:hypothetical protein